MMHLPSHANGHDENKSLSDIGKIFVCYHDIVVTISNTPICAK